MNLPVYSHLPVQIQLILDSSEDAPTTISATEASEKSSAGEFLLNSLINAAKDKPRLNFSYEA